MPATRSILRALLIGIAWMAVASPLAAQERIKISNAVPAEARAVAIHVFGQHGWKLLRAGSLEMHFQKLAASPRRNAAAPGSEFILNIQPLKHSSLRLVCSTVVIEPAPDRKERKRQRGEQRAMLAEMRKLLHADPRPLGP